VPRQIPQPGPEPGFYVWRQRQGVDAMDNRELRRRCAALVADLPVPAPFDVGAFCAQLGRDRGRPIHQLTMDLPPGGPCGLLVSTQDADHVLVERRTSPWHQQNIALHELGHLLWGHDRVLSQDASLLLMPHLAPEMVSRVLARTAYSNLEERQAELVASLILERVSRWSAESTRTVPGAVDAAALARIEETLRGRGDTGAQA